jgi:hypothetical protein
MAPHGEQAGSEPVGSGGPALEGLAFHRVPPSGSMKYMAREKATITLDRSKAASARALLGVGSTSEAIDVALDQLIHAERLRADIAAYQRTPPTQDEVALASFDDTGGIGDDTDWEALYANDLS